MHMTSERLSFTIWSHIRYWDKVPFKKNNFSPKGGGVIRLDFLSFLYVRQCPEEFLSCDARISRSGASWSQEATSRATLRKQRQSQTKGPNNMKDPAASFSRGLKPSASRPAAFTYPCNWRKFLAATWRAWRGRLQSTARIFHFI